MQINSLLTLKTINIFLAHVRSLKKQNFLDAAGKYVCNLTPTEISLDMLLPGAKNSLANSDPTS